MKKAFLVSLVLIALVSLTNIAQAQSNCVVNGRQVPCDQVFDQAGRALGWAFGAMAIFFVVGVLAFIFWLWMLIHVAIHKIENQVVWVLIIVFTGIIGAIIYYFVVKKELDKQEKSTPVSTPPTSTPPAAIN